MTREQIIEIVASKVDWTTIGKWTVPLITGEDIDAIADEILVLEKKIKEVMLI